MSIYATWKLAFNSEGTLATGPEELVRSQGIDITAVWSAGSPETGALILGKISSTPTNVSKWQLTLVTREEAEQLIRSTFTYMPANPDKFLEEYTIEKALSQLD